MALTVYEWINGLAVIVSGSHAMTQDVADALDELEEYAVIETRYNIERKEGTVFLCDRQHRGTSHLIEVLDTIY